MAALCRAFQRNNLFELAALLLAIVGGPGRLVGAGSTGRDGIDP
jgi:hypothetical protein